MNIEEIIFIYKTQPHLTVKEISRKLNRTPDEIRKVMKEYYIRDDELSFFTKFIYILLTKKGNTPQNRNIIAKKFNMTAKSVQMTFHDVKRKIR